MLAPLGSLRVAGARLEDGGRTLILATDPHPRQAVYELDVPESGSCPKQRVRYDLRGVEVSWSEGENADPAWEGWWPSLDSDEVRDRTRHSARHLALWPRLKKPGRLTLRTLLTLPSGKGTIRVRSSGPVQEALLAGEAVGEAGEAKQAALPFESTGEPIDLSLTVATAKTDGEFALSVSLQAESDRRERPFSPDHLTVTWAPSPPPASSLDSRPPTLEGGDRSRGETIFFGQEAKCSSCHRHAGRGGEVGPDLSDEWRRSPAEVYRDVVNPSAVIHPDYVPYTVAMKDGRVVVGVVRAEGPDSIRVTNTEAKATTFLKSEIEALRPSATSIMPVGLEGALGPERMRDLLTFLLTPPPGQKAPAR